MTHIAVEYVLIIVVANLHDAIPDTKYLRTTLSLCPTSGGRVEGGL
jgi:hypothetical protein